MLGTGTTSGTGLGPFTANAVSLASGLPLTLDETMAAGSVNTLSAYRSVLNCTNGTAGSTTPLPVNVVTTSYNFGALQFGDAVICTFTNTPHPRMRLRKALGGTRVFADDQFVMNVRQGTTVLATRTTTGTGATVGNATTPFAQGTAGTIYNFNEVASGTTNLNFYTPTMTCTNANSTSTTPLPNTPAGTITPVLGDVVTCTLTNTPRPGTVALVVTKTSAVVSDPVNGTTNPKMIPGAVVRYTISVTNTDRGTVDASTVVITDPLPANVTFYGVAPTVTFTDATPASGLAFNPATGTTYSSQTGGGAPFTATPVLDGDGYASNISGLRIAPTGTMLGATAAGNPGFTVSFLVRIN